MLIEPGCARSETVMAPRGMLSTPASAINGQIVSQGQSIPSDEILALVRATP